MKESYFTPDTRQAKALDMLRELEPFRRKPPATFTPARSALLVLDMQTFFLSAASHAWVPSAEAILPGIQTLAQAYAACAHPVVFTRHVNSPADAGSMAAWWRDLIAEEDAASAITPQLDTSLGEVMRKSQYDAFFQTQLDDRLRSRSVRQLVIAGVMTHLCCETTARAAFVRGFEVFFLVDGTATYNERFHRASLLNLSHGFAQLVLVGDILQAMQEQR